MNLFPVMKSLYMTINNKNEFQNKTLFDSVGIKNANVEFFDLSKIKE